MKAIRIAAVGVALTLGSSLTASAQAKPAAMQQGGARTPRVDPRFVGIEMSAAQKEKFNAIIKKYGPEQAAVRALQKTDAAAAEVKKTELMTKRIYPEVRAILTPAQQAQFDKNLAEVKAHAAKPTR